MITAFSRADPKRKAYVQDKLRENAKEINALLLAGANFYVCGDAFMAKDVNALLERIIAEQRGLPLDEGVASVKKMRAASTYQEDAWS
jgi:NADPH-ferrihemoprotein reductase